MRALDKIRPLAGLRDALINHTPVEKLPSVAAEEVLPVDVPKEAFFKAKETETRYVPMWNTFRRVLKKDYQMNDKWVDNKAGALKIMIGELAHVRKYVQRLTGSDMKYCGALIRDLRETIVKNLVETSKRHELYINEGVFRRFISDHIPELDGKEGVPVVEQVAGPTDQDPEIDDLVRRMMEWFE